MIISTAQIQSHNAQHIAAHETQLAAIRARFDGTAIDIDKVIDILSAFGVAIPSWALGAGGTRFGRFSIGGEPRNLEEKLYDVGVIHALTKTAPSISLHFPWDNFSSSDASTFQQLARQLGLSFDAVNSNTFQDQPGQAHSYKYGSLCHTNEAVRQQAIDHNLDVIDQGKALDSKAITVWLADGSTFPGQSNMRHALDRTLRSLEKIYSALPEDWLMFIEYKPYEPNFYSMVIPDWGTSYMLAESLGPKAKTLVDLGHHLPNTNIEQIVATLQYKGKLGGFHFNDSKYGDDDLTVGAIKPYQLFLIFKELVQGMFWETPPSPIPAWMIDASHNLKDPLEDLIQSLDAILCAYAQALLIDHQALYEAQENNDVALAQEILHQAYRTDVRPLVQAARLKAGAAIDPVQLFRELNVRGQLIEERGVEGVSTGL